jgi:uncharacterized membrane protein
VTHFIQSFLADPASYLWKGILIIFIGIFLIKYAKELWEDM